MKYDVIIIGAGPGGIFSAYELVKTNPVLFEMTATIADHIAKSTYRVSSLKDSK